mmetsp:Transcript_31111/g.66230  ORF Transcript_31111/g.66230 Transcript_31111/m.66230 type:complete len:113 (-) Transcript_31111:459-797(-)
MKHLPGFVDKANELKAKGVDTIACFAVNDVFVMDAWGKDRKVDEAGVVMLADGNGDYTQALGLELDLTKFGLGMRGQRFSIIVQDGVVEKLNVEPPDAELTVSSAECMLGQL